MNQQLRFLFRDQGNGDHGSRDLSGYPRSQGQELRHQEVQSMCELGECIQMYCLPSACLLGKS